MIVETWHVDWNWNKKQGLLVIHVFPHRTFLIKSDKIDETIIPYLAGLSCFNVILGQSNEMKIQIESKKSLPKTLAVLADYLNEISEGIFSLQFTNLSNYHNLKAKTGNILLFSGGKDSIWQLRYLIEYNKASELSLLYVSGATIAGEYLQELETVYKFGKDINLDIISVESFDYTSIGLNFRNRARWRTLMLIGIARMFSDEIWTGISEDKRYITGDGLVDTDKLNFFSETPKTLQKLAKILNCNILLTPLESYCFFDIESQNQSYRSCYSPDVLCSPETDFKNSCWKCRTLHIYRKIGKNQHLNDAEKSFFNSDDWPGDDKKEIIKNAQQYKIAIPRAIIGK